MDKSTNQVNVFEAMYGNKTAKYTPGAVVNWFLYTAAKSGQNLTQMKVQKLLYFAHGWNLATNKDPLVNELPEAWEYGPVFPSVYHEYKKFGNQPIPVNNYMKELEKGAHHSWNFVTHFVAPEDIHTTALLEHVWSTYSKYDAITLSNMTHKPDPQNPWVICNDWAQKLHTRGTDIPNPFILNYFVHLQQTNQTY